MSTVVEVIVLAAGKGTRMRSARAKVLHQLASRPLLMHVLDSVSQLTPGAIHIVVGHQAEQVREVTAGPIAALTSAPVHWVLQEEQRGTGHAVLEALPGIDPQSLVLVVYGDVPMVTPATLEACIGIAARGQVGLVTARVADPTGLGRIVRDTDGSVRAIVEHRDATAEERAIEEINTGIMALQASDLARYLAQIEPANAQGEYYLTDVIGLASAAGQSVQPFEVDDPDQALGINDRRQLAALEGIYRSRAVAALYDQGISVADPARVDVRGQVSGGEDSFLDVNVILEGSVALGRDVYIGPGSVVRNSTLGDGVRIEAHTLVDGASVAAGCMLGPFARIRPGTVLQSGVRIGNFVETKKAVIGPGSKANHLAYLGDTNIGAGCNLGAGTVTCNYDGIDKHHTEIGDRVFVGTNSTLVAPLELEDDAFVAAGSTVTTRVRSGELAVGRGRQRNVRGWTRPDRRRAKDHGRAGD